MGYRRISSLMPAVLVACAVALTSGPTWAIYYELGPSPDEWGLKYSGNVTSTTDGKLNVQFTLADQGRLKTIHSVHIFALSPPSRDGSRTYLLKAGMPMQTTPDGKMCGQLQIGRELANVAVVRIFSYTLDGQPQRQGVRYYDIPLRKLGKQAPLAAAPKAKTAQAPPATTAPPVDRR